MALTAGQIVREIPSILRDLGENHITKRLKVIAPTVLQVNVNLRCNTQCAMCQIWEVKSPHELSLEQFSAIFADPMYRRIEYLLLAGGEPTLRNDLPELVELMHKNMPRLKKLMIPSNVINGASVRRQFPRIARYCAEHKIRLTLAVSLDGIGETHDKIRGVKDAFAKVMDSIAFLKQLQAESRFNLSLDPTIFSMNVHEMQELKALARRLELPITFQIAAIANDYYQNAETANAIALDQSGRRTLGNFLRRQIAESSFLDALAYYYAEVVEHLEGQTARSLPCPFADQGLLLNPDGTLQYCHNSRSVGNALTTSSSSIYYQRENLAYRDQIKIEQCPSCRMSCLFFVSLRKQVFPFLAFVSKRILGIHRLHWRRPKLSLPLSAAARR